MVTTRRVSRAGEQWYSGLVVGGLVHDLNERALNERERRRRAVLPLPLSPPLAPSPLPPRCLPMLPMVPPALVQLAVLETPVLPLLLPPPPLRLSHHAPEPPTPAIGTRRRLRR